MPAVLAVFHVLKLIDFVILLSYQGVFNNCVIDHYTTPQMTLLTTPRGGNITWDVAKLVLRGFSIIFSRLCVLPDHPYWEWPSWTIVMHLIIFAAIPLSFYNFRSRFDQNKFPFLLAPTFTIINKNKLVHENQIKTFL